MAYSVRFHAEFREELRQFSKEVRIKIGAAANTLADLGPALGRPFVDTLTGSTFANMKELRLTVSDGEWRVAFAFDPKRNAILLVAGSKPGVPSKQFYESLITSRG